jgi:hypothetical protein
MAAAKARKETEVKLSKVTIGMKVRYHPTIGRGDDGKVYVVQDKGMLSGEPVVWLEGKAGCVSVYAVSVVDEVANAGPTT